MRVIHISNSFERTSHTFIRSYVLKSNTFGQSLTVSTSEGDSLADKTLPQIYYDRTIPRELIFYLYDKILSKTRRQRAWDKVIKEFDPVIIHAHFGLIGILAKELMRDLEIPFVTSFYGYDAFQLPRQNPLYTDNLDALFEERRAYFMVEGPHLKKQ
ncbi:MAG: hypothetical protein HRT61_18645, partial [Ekhidna sp.]|nr:hypothetical protein [Ekhidna sp.]